MKELLDRFGTEFDDAEGYIRIVGADWFADDLRLDVSLQMDDGQEPELWEILCRSVVEEKLTSVGSIHLKISDDSPLLKPYTEPSMEVAFTQNDLSPEFLFGVICSCCIESAEKSDYIPKYLNLKPTSSGISSAKFGILGSFPASIALSIEARLVGKPIVIKTLVGKLPTRWNGTEFQSYPSTLAALEIGPSYVIAADFTATRA